MLSIYVFTIVFYLFPLITTEQCPSTKFCTCSPDLTVINCINQQLTNEFLFEKFPQSTVVLNLSSNSLTSVQSLSKLTNLQTLDLSSNRLQSIPSNIFSKFPQLSSLYLQSNFLKTIPKTFNEISNINLDISSNPLQCTCQLKWLVKWFETINLIKKINCQKSRQLTEADFCLTHPKNFISISPSQSQIVYENDPIIFNCSSNTNTFWTFNDELYSNNATVFIPHVQFNHSGIWTCHSWNLNRSISLQVLSLQSNHFCPSIQMDTSKGHFFWPRTLTGQTKQLPCPFQSAAWLKDSLQQAQAFYTCSRSRQWTQLDLSQCAFRTNISRQFDEILSTNQTNLLSRLIHLMSKIDLKTFLFDDIIFLIDLINDEYEHSVSRKQNLDEITMLIYRLTDLILQIPEDNLFMIKEYHSALNRLRSIVENLIEKTNPSWIYVGKQLTAMTLESVRPPTVCFVPNRSLLTIICGILNRQYRRTESRLATIQFPSQTNSSTNQSSIYKILFYRQSRLYPIDRKFISNPVIYMKSVKSTDSSTVQLTFYGQSNQAAIGVWKPNETAWQVSPSICKLNQQNIDLISTDCLLKNQTSLAITYLNQLNEYRYLLFSSNYLDLAIYVSSVIASACLLICILFYVSCSNVFLMPRSFFHCLINYWLSLAILFPLFAFGIRQTEYVFVCQLISISLHYLCLTTILWLTLLAYCIWQKLYMIWSGKGHESDENGENPKVTIVDYDDDGLPIIKLKTKPIIQYYFLAYGISFIICGINVAISREQYLTNKICFLNTFESLLTLVIPFGIFAFLLLIFLLAGKLNIKRLTKEAIRLRNLPDESDGEPETNLDTEENLLPLKPTETLPMIEKNLPHIDCNQSHLDSICSSDMDHQHQPTNQLHSILFQVSLLICIFASSLAIYIHPLQNFQFRYEHSIYTHFYGFFVLLLAFYILAFYVLTRSDLTMHCQFSNRTKKRLLNQSYVEPPPPPQSPQPNDEFDRIKSNFSGDESFTEPIPAPSSPQPSSIYQSQQVDTSEVASVTYGSKRQTSIASKYYARHRHMLKTSVSNSETSLQPNETLPTTSNLTPIKQETEKSPQTLIQPSTASPSQAIIRPLPIVRLTSPAIADNTSGRNSYRIMPSPSTEERQATYIYLNQNPHLIQQDPTPSTKKLSNGHFPHVAYIDEDDEASVSLKSSACDSSSSSTTSPVVTRKERSKTISSSSSSTYSSQNLDPNQIILHESSV